MSLESGGRADKYGNQYENRYLSRLLLMLVQGKYASIIVEPLGTNHDAVEYITEDHDGKRKYYQCKAANGQLPYWHFRELHNYEVFVNAKKIILENEMNEYHFISPLTCGEIGELCKRSRTNNSADEFYENQLTNEKLRNDFKKISDDFNLNFNNKDELNEIVYILSKCFFESFSFDDNEREEFELYISLVFTGNTKVICRLLEDYVLDTNSFGKKVTSNDVLNYLFKRDITLNQLTQSGNLNNIFDTINNIYYGEFSPITDKLIHRSVTDKIISEINMGKSVILHGRAGAGKSGCLQELSEYLATNDVLYLRVKLDIKMPKISAKQFGLDLGLPDSPIVCLAQLATDKKCVLILDQLDALRWNANHSAEALGVCKELIRQCNIINQKNRTNISIVFAARTFDLENDIGLKSLFDSNDNKFSKINVDYLDKEDVINVIGNVYNDLTSRLQQLLVIPSNLYIWTKLDNNDQNHNISSFNKLMKTWEEQILRKSSQINLESKNIIDAISTIVDFMEQSEVFFVYKDLLLRYNSEIEFLISTGLLRCNEKNNTILFVHQSFLDYFITKKILTKIFYGNSLVDNFYDYNNQTPFVRYRFLAILQNLLDTSEDLFIAEAEKIMMSENFHYYFKCAIFEIIGQCEKPTNEIYNFVEKYVF